MAYIALLNTTDFMRKFWVYYHLEPGPACLISLAGQPVWCGRLVDDTVSVCRKE